MARSTLPRAAVIIAGIAVASTASADPPAPPSKDPPAQGANKWGDGPPPEANEPGPARGKGRRVVRQSRPVKRLPPAPSRKFVKGKWVKVAQGWRDGIPGGAIFQRFEDGTSRVSVEMDRKTDIEERKANGRIVFRIKSVGVMDRVNYLPLVTSYFKTQVERVQLVDEGSDTDLVIEVREASPFTHKIVETPRGIVLQVDFPKSLRQDPEDTEVERARARQQVESQSLRPSDQDRGIKEY